MTILRKEMECRLKLKGFSKRTIATYLQEVRLLSEFYQKSPDQIDTAQMQQYFLHLITERKFSRSKIITAHAGIKFFVEKTLERPWNNLALPAMSRDKKLPIVLSKEKILRIFSCVSNVKYRNICQVIYSSGARLSEALHLRIEDIDSSRMMVRIKAGKGRKDRYTLLGNRALADLREYWKKEKPKFWLFPGKSQKKPITCRHVQYAFQDARKKAGVLEHATLHSLRHSFAVHLLESGCDIVQIQRLLGHSSIMTTIRYLHMRSLDPKSLKNPFDD